MTILEDWCVDSGLMLLGCEFGSGGDDKIGQEIGCFTALGWDSTGIRVVLSDT